MKVYEAIFNEEDQEGVYALSVVEDPAMQDVWIALKDHPKNIELATVSEEKRLLLGAALIPDKKIYRNMDGQEFYITFKAETIEKLAHNFIKNGFQNNSTLEHEVQLSGMSVVEAWTVKDPDNDKSAAFGKTYPEGTWVCMMKVENDEVWDKVKNNEIKGFSIDALLNLKEVELKSEINMNRTEFLEALKDVFKMSKDVEETPQDIQETPAEEIEVKSEEVTEEVTEAEVKDLSTDALKEQLQDVLAQFKADTIKEIESIKAEFATQKKDLEDKIEAKDKEIEALNVELSKAPEVESVKSEPKKSAPVEYEVRGFETTKDRVFRQLAKNVWS